MNIATLTLLLCGFAGVFCNDHFWMKLLSARIENAVNYDLSVDEDIPELASQLGFKTLVSLVKKAGGLAGQLSGAGPFTLFAPNDEAFAKLPVLFLDVLASNTTLLNMVLKYHVGVGNVQSGDLKNDGLVSTLMDFPVRINLYKNDKVATASGSRIVMVDQQADNGVIHEVKDVLLPPPGDAFFILKTCPLFSTLLAAVSSIESVVGLLTSDGPFTFFAPPDVAFAKLPNGCLDKLLNDEKSLTKLLEYHVVPLTGYSAGLSSGDELKTEGGDDVTIVINGDRIQVNDAEVLYPDCTVTNGVIHVINKVLIPKELENFCDDDSLHVNDDNKIYGIRAWRNLLN